ncbi:MAG: hypothetical protein J1E98_03675 [Lachnospiraceae bacterium]|nr:hypothetical protein [Lachnospiraceae bacterium]
MDYNNFEGLYLDLGFVAMDNLMKQDRFSNMTDDEKKEYIERNRSVLSEDTIDRMEASIVEEDDVPDLDKPSGTFGDHIN